VPDGSTGGDEPPRRYAAVVGPRNCPDELVEVAQEVGRGLAQAGFTVVTGGEGGAMEAASRGAREAGGTVVGILPGKDRSGANVHADITVVTAIGHARNLAVVASGDVVVALGGEWGTLSEIAFAGVMGRPVVALSGWRVQHASEVPAGLHYADSAGEAVALAVKLTG
jgi:uncharacterized protein (TIGR00725 family)